MLADAGQSCWTAEKAERLTYVPARARKMAGPFPARCGELLWRPVRLSKASRLYTEEGAPKNNPSRSWGSVSTKGSGNSLRPMAAQSRIKRHTAQHASCRPMRTVSTTEAIQHALEAAGIEFISKDCIGSGIRLKKPRKRHEMKLQITTVAMAQQLATMTARFHTLAATELDRA